MTTVDQSEGMSYLESMPRRILRVYLPLGVIVFFLLSPTAWVSLKGVLSEAPYLLLCMAALLFHQRRIESSTPSKRDWLLFGLLMACAYLTRAIGLMLIAAFLVQRTLEKVSGTNKREMVSGTNKREMVPGTSSALFVPDTFFAPL